MDIYAPLRKSILATLPDLLPDDITFSNPPSLEMGDLAVPLFLAARRLRQAPPKLAAELAASVDFGSLVRECKAAGPYLNLRLDRPAFARSIVQGILRGGDSFGSNASGKGVRAIIEHTSINPNAEPHVGRARCAMVGDSLSRLFRFEQYDVEVHYYVNDMGRQIGLLVLVADELEQLAFDQILDAYVRANKRAEDDPAFAEAGYALLVKMEEGDPGAQQKFKAVTDLCLAGQLAVLERINAHYDVFDRESKFVSDPRLERVEAALREKGALFTDDEQRLVVDLSKLGYTHEEGRFFVLRRANGSSMYGYRDLAYTIDKHEQGADLNIIVLGEDHKLYAQQLALILETAGYPAPEAVYYSYILLKSGKMSTRQGNVVLLSEFLDQARALAAERVAEQCTSLPEEEQAKIAEQVAVAAIRFAILRVGPNKNMTFDMEAALSFQGDTGPYIQYSCARIRSILRKHGQPLPEQPADSFPVESDAEWLLLSKLELFPGVVAGALAQRNASNIAQYALEVARQFTSFYHDCPVLTAGTPELVQARLQICRATLQTLQNALWLLGMEIPERM